MADEVYEITSDDIKPGQLAAPTLEKAQAWIKAIMAEHNSYSDIKVNEKDFKITKIEKKDKPTHWYFR